MREAFSAACGWMFTDPPPGGGLVFSKCTHASFGSPLSSSTAQSTENKQNLPVFNTWQRRGLKKFEPQMVQDDDDPRRLSFTQTCAGDCRGTGRRWRHTWDLVYAPWSSCHPPRSAGRTQPSLWRHKQKNTSELSCRGIDTLYSMNIFYPEFNQKEIWKVRISLL